MKVAVIFQGGFPTGLASTNRALYYAKGLVDNGVESEVIIVKPTEAIGSLQNTIPIGNYEGVPFCYSTGNSFRSSFFLKRRFYDLIGPIKGAVYIIKNKFDAVILSSNSFAHPMFFKIIFRLFGIKFIVERSESMFHGKNIHGIYKLRKWIYEKIIYKNIDALFAISSHSVSEYKLVVSKKTPVFLIPIMADHKSIYNPEIKRTRNLVYTGPLVQKKDGILTIIEAFTNIAGKFPETNLILTGDLQKTPDRENIMKLLENNPFKNRIIFKGFVSREEMIELLNSAAGLVLAKPTSEQSVHCFPTKICEYLASSNPAVITSSGEVNLFLKDGIDAFIAEPDSVSSFSDKLEELLSDPEKAKKVGESGRKVAVKDFNYSTVAQKIITIIEDLKK